MKRFFLFLGIAAMAVACHKPVAPELTINSDKEVTVSAEGETVSVQITSNVAWTASISNSSWASVMPASGEAGSATIKVSVMKNDETDARSLDLTVTAMGEEETKTEKVVINQLQKNALVAPGDAIEIDCNEQDVNIALKANVDYDITPGVDWITVVKTKALSDYTAVVHVALNKSDKARTGSVQVKGDGVNAEVTIKQGAFEPKFEVIGAEGGEGAYYMYLGAEGGEAAFQINTNMEWEITTYDSFDWAPFSGADGSYKFTVGANKGYDPRTAYVKFTTSEIQDAVFDEAGEPTGEYVDHVERVYVIQTGLMAESWAVDFNDAIALPATHSIALFGGKVYVANPLSTGLFVFDAATGAAAGTVDLSGFTSDYVNSIASDDKGNLVIAFGGNYPLEEGVSYIPLQIFAIPAGKEIAPANATKLVEYTNGFYGYGLDNIEVNGDVTAEAAISMVTAVGYDGGSFAVSWQVENGAATDSYTDYVTLPTGAAVWYSGDLTAIHASSKVSGGIFYIGYDAHYDLCYNPGMSYADWQHILPSGSSWAENFSGIDCVEWNGSKYVVFLSTAFFNYWGMPSYVTLVNVDDPTAPVLVSQSEHYTAAGVTFSDVYVNETTGDITASVEDGKLAVYFADAGIGQVKKIVFDVLQ